MITLTSAKLKLSAKALSCLTLVALSDFLFYEQMIGWTLGFFDLLLLLTIAIHQPAIATSRYSNLLACAALGLGLAQIEKPTALSFYLFLFTIVATVLAPKLEDLNDARRLVRSVLCYLLTGWARIYRDTLLVAHLRKRSQKSRAGRFSLVLQWLLPLTLSAIFILLFAEANPIITRWLDVFGRIRLGDYFSIPRLFFWLSIAAGCWALIRPKFKPRQRRKIYLAPSTQRPTLTGLLFNERSILTSLILFNLLFLVQNLLDIAFLWSGAVLPEGMTYAQYAHQGAYPLMVTALLAAVFVLIALKPGSWGERQPVVRQLVYAWVGQNIFLVGSSITRLLGYMEEYSLTYLRVSALIWMGLVALGLLLIVARIYWRRSNVWLINANSIALYATLYICCFINFGGLIAGYNVMHSHEVSDNGAFLDTYYLQSEIGVQAIPALVWFENTLPNHARTQDVRELRRELQARLAYTMQDWRQRTFRQYRLSHID